MPLLGKAAMLLSFDIAADAIVEHDDWHTHEHLPERLAIPGFVRGSRWTVEQGRPGYFVMYEVDELATLGSADYLERLNNPTPWTTKIMSHYVGMSRGLCRITASIGAGLGQTGLLIRFKPAPGGEAGLREWLVDEAMPGLPGQAGLARVHLFEAALAPQSTSEQRIRGRDAALDWALLVTGYSPESVAGLVDTEIGEAGLRQRGAIGLSHGIYRMAFSLTAREAATPESAGP
jgi:hypothetical protein